MEAKSIEKENSKFPEFLKSISDPPKQLYYKGEWSEDLFDNCLAVVGSRRMTQYGKNVTEMVVGQCAASGVTIVSGFMFGVDAQAHQTAIDAGGRTVAVMPCGIERIHPSYQKELYEKIIQTGGLILSEWEGNSTPVAWTFPRRNRIVAGLSKATLVVEAALGSGSLITAECAYKYGRKVFAVPGPITSDRSEGTNQLIQQGASLVSSADDILGFFGKKELARKKKALVAYSDNPIERQIIQVLQKESVEIDWIARKTGMTITELNTTLSLMELQGVIGQEAGKYYVN